MSNKLPNIIIICLMLIVLFTGCSSAQVNKTINSQYDVVIVGATPGGIMSAIAIARNGHSALLLDRNEHIGGLPANGLGATDIHTRGATAGLFTEFVNNIKQYYIDKYGPDSRQVEDCSDGYHFEPTVAEIIFNEMLSEYSDRITVKTGMQFDSRPENVILEDGKLTAITVGNRDTGRSCVYKAGVFIDATYEGDLAAAAGCGYRLGREAASEFNEPMAGVIYKAWAGKIGPGSTAMADNAVQAYNFRLCLTKDKSNQVPIPKPEIYNRAEYVSLVDDVINNRGTSDSGSLDGIHTTNRLVNTVNLPNNKTDANNQHWAFISTDLPEENWPWPTSGWQWRDKYANRLRDYTLGLWWFSQHDPALPEKFRDEQLQWGLAADEYLDNDNFPRQVYVREGRRIIGRYFFTANDALSKRASRDHVTSITASHYALDSHAVRKREEGRLHLDGFFSKRTQPYSVPYGVIVPKDVDGLLIPVPVSGTHVGFSTLRMEPCWMALGQAAGTTAAIAIDTKRQLKNVDIVKLQKQLIAQGAVLIYYKDVKPADKHFEALQMLGLRGFLGKDTQARLNDPVKHELAKKWFETARISTPLMKFKPGATTRGQMLDLIYSKLDNKQLGKLYMNQ